MRRTVYQRARRRVERPWALTQGIRGPRYFRTLLGAQGWADANWPHGDGAEVKNLLTGHHYRRQNALWERRDAPEPAVEPRDPPYWIEGQ